METIKLIKIAIYQLNKEMSKTKREIDLLQLLILKNSYEDTNNTNL